MKKLLPTLATLCAIAAPAQDNANLMSNGNFAEEMKGVDFWDPQKDSPHYDVEKLPRIAPSDHPDGGNALFFPKQDALQTAALTQNGHILTLRGHNLELTVTYKSPDPALDAYAEVVLDWATWPNIAQVALPAGEGWQTATVAFKATRRANNLTVCVRNRGASELYVHEVFVKKLPDDPGQLPAPREVKDGELPAWTADGTWAFKAGDDPYTDETLFDLRPLLDKTAGEKGWIRHDENGDFIRGDGSPIRFWAMGTHGLDDNGSFEVVEAQARFLAKLGVNMVRLFPSSFKGEDKQIDSILKAVAAYKKHGIYSTITIYWRSDGKLFWDKDRQEEYKDLWRKVLLRPNPYDPAQTPLKDDPALAILQIQNEDSWLFWSMWGSMWDKGRRETEYVALNAMFQKWLDEKGLDFELDETAKNWFFVESKDSNYPPDSKLDFRFWLGEDRSKVPPISFRRSMQFAGEVMFNFNTEIAAFLRDEIGCPALINAGNWYTADQVLLLDIERWSYTANDVIGQNRYMDLSHHDNAFGRVGWLIEPTDHYTSASLFTGETTWRGFSPNVKQVKGKPFIMPEASLVYPNLYQSEGPLLVSAYQSLTGVDAIYWFQLGGKDYEIPGGGWNGGMWKWNTQGSPSGIGTFPAAAWLLHKNLVRRGPVAVDEKRGLDGDMWELKVPVIAEDSSFDPNRPGTNRAQSNIEGGVPFGAFMVGPVHVEYGKDASGTTVDLAGNTPENLARGVVRSNTGELYFDAPKGFFTLDAPCAQGATGFLKKNGPLSTAALDIALDNDYATVIAVSLDDKPLVESAKVLLQITTLSRPNGWTETPVRYDSPHGGAVDGFRIDALLAPAEADRHWNVKNTLGTVAIKNPGLTKATLADANFYAAGNVPVERQGGKLVVKLPPNAMYVVLE